LATAVNFRHLNYPLRLLAPLNCADKVKNISGAK